MGPDKTHGWGWRGALAVLAVAVLLAGLAIPRQSVEAFGWLGRVGALGGKVGQAGKLAGGLVGLEGAAHVVRSLPVKPGSTPALAASVGTEGHWRLVNRAGETFTAATSDELRRGIAILLPETAGKADVRIAFYVTEESAFGARTAFKDLPAAADLHLVAGDEVLRLLRRSDGAGQHLAAEVRPALVVAIGQQRPFREALWQLSRPLNRANIRQLALEPGGPPTLSTAPRLDKPGGKALTDRIDPKALPRALSAIRGQTALVTGRVEGELLHFLAPSGKDASLSLPDLVRAAAAADVNLIVLKTASTRQPGSRNWLWLKVETSGLDAALGKATLGDFLNALASEHGRMALSPRLDGLGRVQLTALPVRVADAAPVTAVGAFDEVITGLTGHLPVKAMELALRSSERQRELDDRIVPGIRSDIQFTYLGALVLGLLFGASVAAGWFARIWPPETRSEYTGRFGYEAARAVRGLAFVLIFLPVVALPAVLVSLVKRMMNWIGVLSRRIFGARTDREKERST